MQEFLAVFTIQNLFTLAMLILLQAVLGFDNLLYISIESKRVEPDQQQKVRKIGITLAIALRIVLLFAIMQTVKYLKNPLFKVDIGKYFYGDFTIHSLIVFFGGAFILWTALKEILHLLTIDELEHEGSEENKRTMGAAIFWIVVMNLIFSFDSILSAMALTKNFWVMAIAIVISGLGMIWLAEGVSNFLKKNRMYEVLGLFILFIVGIMLVSEGGHLAHLKLFGYPVEPMTKTTFYFVLAVLVIVDIVQGRYQKKLMAQKEKNKASNQG